MLATKAAKTAPIGDSSVGFTYAQVELALARVFGFAEVDGRLRGRIQHLRRLGLTPPADGGRVLYTLQEGWPQRWLIALELGHLNTDPSMAAEFINKNWDAPHKRDAEQAVDEGVATLGELVMVAPTRKDNLILTVRFAGQATDLPVCGYFFVQNQQSRADAAIASIQDQDMPLDEALPLLARSLSNLGQDSFLSWLNDATGRHSASCIPLSARLRQLDRALNPLSRVIIRAGRKAR